MTGAIRTVGAADVGVGRQTAVARLAVELADPCGQHAHHANNEQSINTVCITPAAGFIFIPRVVGGSRTKVGDLDLVPGGPARLAAHVKNVVVLKVAVDHLRIAQRSIDQRRSPRSGRWARVACGGTYRVGVDVVQACPDTMSEVEDG